MGCAVGVGVDRVVVGAMEGAMVVGMEVGLEVGLEVGFAVATKKLKTRETVKQETNNKK